MDSQNVTFSDTCAPLMYLVRIFRSAGGGGGVGAGTGVAALSAGLTTAAGLRGFGLGAGVSAEADQAIASALQTGD